MKDFYTRINQNPNTKFWEIQIILFYTIYMDISFRYVFFVNNFVDFVDGLRFKNTINGKYFTINYT